MSDEIKRLMNSRDVEDRKQAVRKLAKTADASALKYLDVVFRTDSDAEVRALAAKAGRYINQQLAAAPAVMRPPAPIQQADDDEPEIDSQSPQAEAQRWILRAREQYEDGQVDDARKLAGRAFAHYRPLKQDAYYVGLLAQIMETHSDIAVAELVSYLRGDRDPRKKKGDTHLDDTSFIALMGYLGVIVLVTVASVMVVSVFLSLALRPQLETLRTVMEQDPLQSSYIQNTFGLATQMLTLSPDQLGDTVARGLSVGLQSVLSLLISYFFINLTANNMAGGDGTFSGLVRVTMPITVGSTLLSYLALGVFLYVVLQRVLTALYQTSLTNDPLPYQTAITEIGAVTAPFMIFIGLLSLVSLVIFVRGVAVNYKISFLEGCGTIVVAVVIAGCSWCGILYGSSLLGMGMSVAGVN